MVYDIATAYLVASFLSLVMPLVSWGTLRRQRAASVAWWCLGGLTTAAGLLAVGMRASLPELLPFNTGFALCMLGSALQLHAIEAERGRTGTLAPCLGLALAMVAVKEALYQGLPGAPAHFLFTYFSFAALFFLISAASWRLSLSEGTASMRWLSLFNMTAGVLFALRGLAGLTGLTHPDTLLAGPFGILTTAVVVLLTVINNVTLVGLYLERSQKKAARLLLEEERSRAAAELHTHIAAIDRQRSLGEMAAGLAHELGQPIASILMDSSSLRQQLQQGPARAEAAAEIARDIATQAGRASGILAGIRNLIKPAQPQMGPVDLADVLDGVRSILRPLLRPQEVRLRLQLPAPAPVVRGDKVQLSQVLLNLLRNSLQARRPGQVLQLEVTVQCSGDAVELVIEDDGVGMSDAQLASYGTPFATTKAEGLGIGVALSRRIVEHHGGRLSVERPACGRGLRTRLSLPAMA